MQQLAQARADLATAQANVKLAGITATRYQDLLKTDSVSQAGSGQLQRRLTPPSKPWCNPPKPTSSAWKTWNPSSASTRRSPALSPQRNVDIGTLINAGNGGTSTKEMFDLAQTDPLRVYVSVPQSYAPSMHAG